MPKIIKKDWAGWRDGLRSKMWRAGAEALVTNITGLLGTNGVASMNIPGFQDIGMNWKTAIVTTVIQFVLRIVLAAALYVQNRPDPDVITETIETATITKDPETGKAVATVETVTKETPIKPIAEHPISTDDK